MAVDFFVMPISRYLAGDFTTPVMRLAWSLGKPYSLIGVTVREIPIGEPFGGVTSPQRRQHFLSPGMLLDDLGKYPSSVRDHLWDEGSAAEPRFHRVDVHSYGALIEENRNAMRTAHSSWSGLRKKADKQRSHLAAQLFLPIDFDEPFLTEHVFEGWLAGSVSTALHQLSEGKGSQSSEFARETLRQALTDAAELRLPMIVDQ